MDPLMLRKFFAWCSVINLGIVLYWFLMIAFAKPLVYRWHSKWFKVSEGEFDAIHYKGIMFCKLLVFFFNLAPYFALRIIF